LVLLEEKQKTKYLLEHKKKKRLTCSYSLLSCDGDGGGGQKFWTESESIIGFFVWEYVSSSGSDDDDEFVLVLFIREWFFFVG